MDFIKKNMLWGIRKPSWLPKNVFSLRSVFLILLMGTLQVNASMTYSQSIKMSLNVENVSVQKLLSIIEQKSSFYFTYNPQQINANRVVSIKVSDRPIDEILGRIFEKEGVKHVIDGKHIVLYRAGNEKVMESSQQKNQQSRAIKGIVEDINGEPLIGVNIMERGTSNGTITDLSGRFTLQVSSTSVLQISYVGYIEQNLTVGNSSSFTIKLQEDTQRLDEVVIVGYGNQKKVNLTGSVATIGADALSNRAISNLSQGLQGLVPGMTVTNSGGQPGMDAGKILIRGVGSFNVSTPMVLIDGIEGDMNIVDAQDIESISVLKDAASAAIYGSKAANGVILITTKRGKQGAPKINYNGLFGWSSPSELMPRTSSAELAQLTNESEYWGAISEGATPEQAAKRMPYSTQDIQLYADGSDPYGHPNTNWNDLFFVGSGFTNRHNLSIGGGSEWVNYRTSLGYTKQDGIVKNASDRQFNVRVNLDIKINKRLKSKVNLDYVNTRIFEPTNPISWDSGTSEQTYRQVNRISPMVPYKNQDGTYGTISDGNPIAFQDSGAKGERLNDYMTAYAEFSYDILDGLTAKVNGSYYVKNQDYNLYRKEIQYNEAKYDGPTQLTQSYYKDIRSQADVLISYDKTFAKKHTVNIFGGFHSELYKYKETQAYRKGFPSPDVTDLNGGSVVGMTNSGYTRELAMNSVFGRAKYNYADTYLFEVNLRGDASSRFAKGYRWGWFPSFSGAWRLSNEPFMENTREILSDLKLRGSWGVLGNQAIPNDYYPYINTYATTPKYPFNNSITGGAAQTNNKINNLSWETTYTWGVGADMTLFDALSMTIEWYSRKTTGILMQVNVPTTFGYGGYYDNIGKMSNQGVEMLLNYRKQISKVTFNAGMNFSYNKNKVLSLGDLDTQIGSRTITMVGHPYQAFYGYQSDGIFQTKEEVKNAPKYSMIDNARLIPGDIKLVDRDKNGIIDEKDKVILNSENPKYTFGINLGAKWKFFDASLFFQGAAGVSRYFTDEMYGEFNGDSGHPSTLWLGRWTPENPTNKWPRASKFRTYNMPEVTTSDFWLVNTNYLRLKDVQIGFTLPQYWIKNIGFNSVRIYYSGQNLLTVKKCAKGIDPEAPGGWGAYYPHITTHSVGISVTL